MGLGPVRVGGQGQLYPYREFQGLSVAPAGGASVFVGVVVNVPLDHLVPPPPNPANYVFPGLFY